MKAKQFIGFALVCAAAMTAAIFTACDPEEKEKPTHTVTFDADGGTPAPAAQTVTEGEKATAPAAVTKVNYTFLHWSKDGTAAYDFAAPVTTDFTLTAKWEPEMTVTEYWHVTWTLNGGEWPENDNHTTDVIQGEALAEPAAPTRDGYTFDGWYKEAALTNKITFPYSTAGFTTEFTLYAGWTEESGADIDNARLIGKWEAAENTPGIVSVEFGVSGNYIVTVYIEPDATRAVEYDAEDLAAHFGTYTVDGSVVTLSDIGTMTVRSLDAGAISFSLDVVGAGGAVDISAGKAREMPASTKTDLLCRTWKYVDYETDDPEDDGTEETDIAYVYFSKAGTYLVAYTDGTSGLANWKWKSEASGEFYYSWDFPVEWFEDEYVTAETLTENRLAITEYFSGDENGDEEKESYYVKTIFEPVSVSASATRSGYSHVAPVRTGTSGIGFLGR